LPPRTSLASSELGWLATYHSRSDWCIPSTEINRTCLTFCSVRGPCVADGDRAPAEADPAARAPNTATQATAPAPRRKLTHFAPLPTETLPRWMITAAAESRG